MKVNTRIKSGQEKPKPTAFPEGSLIGLVWGGI